MCVPRTIVRPSVRFCSVSTRGPVEADVEPGAEADLEGLDLMRRNSSVSASTRFMCCECLVSVTSPCSQES